VVGGGVMARARLYPSIRSKLAGVLGGYLSTPALGDRIDTFVVPPALGDRAGVLGALALAQTVVDEDRRRRPRTG
jgi:fructokinase